MIIAGSGHRPDKLSGYDLPNPTYIYVCQQIEKHLKELKPTKVLSGMALGFDSYLAHVAIKLNIPLVAVIPFKGQELAWPSQSQKAYNNLLKKASEQIIVCSGGYSYEKMQIRNEYLVNNCDLLLSCWDHFPKGGTYNCIAYAHKQEKKVINIYPFGYRVTKE